MSATILVVDDDPALRELFRRWLDSSEFAVRVAANAREALELMMTERVDIVVVEIRMRDEDGFWFIERIRSTWPRTAIIVATGIVDADTVTRAQQLGVQDYVTKPFGREVLLQALRRAASKTTNPEEFLT